MAELLKRYEGIRDAADAGRIKGVTSSVAAVTARLILAGYGFTDSYTLFYHRTTEMLPAEINGSTGRMPLVGLDLSRMANIRRMLYKDPRVTFCPAGLRDVEVAAWHVGDRRFRGNNEGGGIFGGYRSIEGSGVPVSEVVLVTSPAEIYNATARAVETDIVSSMQVLRVVRGA